MSETQLFQNQLQAQLHLSNLPTGSFINKLIFCSVIFFILSLDTFMLYVLETSEFSQLFKKCKLKIYKTVSPSKNQRNNNKHRRCRNTGEKNLVLWVMCNPPHHHQQWTVLDRSFSIIISCVPPSTSFTSLLPFVIICYYMARGIFLKVLVT